MSFFSTTTLLTINGNKMTLAMAKRRKARVNGSTFWSDHLKTGAAAPQIILAITRAIIACWALDNFIGQSICHSDPPLAREESLLIDCHAFQARNDDTN